VIRSNAALTYTSGISDSVASAMVIPTGASSIVRVFSDSSIPSVLAAVVSASLPTRASVETRGPAEEPGSAPRVIPDRDGERTKVRW
jgi:hypothetical protein